MHRELSFRTLEQRDRGVRPNAPLIVLASVTGTLLIVVVGFVLAYQTAFADRIYPGVRAFGHDLGGYSREEAASVLRQSLDQLGGRQLTVTYREHSWSFTAQELGLKNDPAPVLDAVYGIGRDGHMLTRFSTQFGLWRHGRSYEQPSAAFDPAVQTTLLQRLATEVDRPVQEARLLVRADFSVDLQPALSGRKMDLEASRRRLEEALSNQGAIRAELMVTETSPPNERNNLALAQEQARAILSGPIELQHDGRTWVLDKPQLASILRFDGRLDAERAAYLDQPALEAWSKSLADAVYQEPQDARLSWSGGKLEVVRPSRDGFRLDTTVLIEAIANQAYGERQPIPLPVAVTRPAVPMDERQNLGIKQLIRSSRTPFAGSVQAKQDNITLAARRLNGVVVPPGATFSFNDELGPTTLDSGFKVGWGISSSGDKVRTVPSVAGGICQVATTLFHSVFWAGYPIEERHWHLYWIPAYQSDGQVGLDATVDEEAGLDFKFINPTSQHLLIQAWVDENLNINFALYGTKPDWVVKVESSELTDIQQADRDTTVIDEEPTMPEGNRLQVERATDGFVVTNTRRVISNGGDERTLRLVSRYRPSRNVILVGTGGKPPSGRQTVEKNKPAAEKTPAAAADKTPAPRPTGSAATSGTPGPAGTPASQSAPTATRPAAAPAATPPPPPPVVSTPTPVPPSRSAPTSTPRRR